MKKIPTMKSISECSEIVGLAKYHVRRLVLQGKVKYVRSGSKYLVIRTFFRTWTDGVIILGKTCFYIL